MSVGLWHSRMHGEDREESRRSDSEQLNRRQSSRSFLMLDSAGRTWSSPQLEQFSSSHPISCNLALTRLLLKLTDCLVARANTHNLTQFQNRPTQRPQCFAIAFPPRDTRPLALNVTHCVEPIFLATERYYRGLFLLVIDGLDACSVGRDDVAAFREDLLQFFEQLGRESHRGIHFHRRGEKHRYTSQASVTPVLGRLSLPMARRRFKEASETNKSFCRTERNAYPRTTLTTSSAPTAPLSSSLFCLTIPWHRVLSSRSILQNAPMKTFQLSLNMKNGLDDLYTQILQRARDIQYFGEVIQYTPSALYCMGPSPSPASLVCWVYTQPKSPVS